MIQIDWLQGEVSDHGGTHVIEYPLTYLKTFEYHHLEDDGLIVYKWDEDKFWLKFAVLGFNSGVDDEQFLTVIFHGEGPTDCLRELRHTWWGDGGYIFYPRGKVITDAFNKLRDHFDDI